MAHWLDYLRQLNIVSMMLRIILALLMGGLIGMERERKRRPAGFRTYMLVALGAALTVILSQYLDYMINNPWAEINASIGVKTDASRFGAQVINGVGFLGAGTIIVTGRQEVKGLTTAAGLWASACMGLAIGAGFYECMIVGFALIFLCIHFLPLLEGYLLENARNMNLYIELQSLDALGALLSQVKAQGVQIYSVEIDRGEEHRSPSAVLSVHLAQHQPHTQLLAAISELESVTMIDEI